MHYPWAFEEPELTTSIYRQYVNIHHSLAVYLQSSGSAAYDVEGQSLITPIARPPLLPWQEPSTLAYLLGPNVFVVPIITANVSSVMVHLPSSSSWMDYWNHTVYSKGSSFSYNVHIDTGRYGVFKRVDSIIPLLPYSLHLTSPLPAHAPLDVELVAPSHSAQFTIRSDHPISQHLNYNVPPSISFYFLSLFLFLFLL